MEYVLGFAFNLATESVLLIEKQKPDWQRGLLNGVGGKIEESDRQPHDAMSREFFEETGFHAVIWRRFCLLKHFGNDVHCFSTIVCQPVLVYKGKNTEQPVWVKQKELPTHIMPNLRWLIPMAFDDKITKAEVLYQ